jgi:hypothetical protein
MGDPVVGLVIPAQTTGVTQQWHAVRSRMGTMCERAALSAQERGMALLHRKFKFEEGHDIEEIVVRQTDGYDEKDAAKMVDARPTETGIYSELVRLSIVSVDGELVDQPFMAIDRWSTKTRDLVMTAYNELNENDEAAKAVFLAASEDVAPLVQRPQPREGGSTPPTT